MNERGVLPGRHARHRVDRRLGGLAIPQRWTSGCGAVAGVVAGVHSSLVEQTASPVLQLVGTGLGAVLAATAATVVSSIEHEPHQRYDRQILDSLGAYALTESIVGSELFNGTHPLSHCIALGFFAIVAMAVGKITPSPNQQAPLPVLPAQGTHPAPGA